jgi:hypothetical protein
MRFAPKKKKRLLSLSPHGQFRAFRTIREEGDPLDCRRDQFAGGCRGGSCRAEVFWADLVESELLLVFHFQGPVSLTSATFQTKPAETPAGPVQQWVQSEGSCLASAAPFTV